MSGITVYEKPTCTTCRKLVELLASKGVDFERVNYHVSGLEESELRMLLRKSNLGPRDLLRQREPLVKELDLPGTLSDDELIALMVEQPQLVQRPIVVKGERAVLARPVEEVLTLFE